MEKHTENESFSIINDPRMEHAHEHLEANGDVKLLFSKSKVYVHPSTNVKDFIPGYFSIIQKTHGYLVAWTPESLIPSKDIESFVQVDLDPDNAEPIESSILIPSSSEQEDSLYALSANVDSIDSFVIKAPCFSKWYGSVVINFKDGHSSSPFWFHDDESKSTMLQKNTQGGKYTENDGQVRWGGDEFIERLGQLIPVRRSETVENLYLLSIEKTSSNNTQTVFESTQMDPFMASLKEAKWSFLEKLSRVTKFSRDAAIGLINHPASKPLVPLLPPSVQQLYNSETVRKTMDDYDSARIFLAKWAAGLAAQSEQSAPREQRYRHVGVWGHDGWEEDTALGVFEILNSENDFSIPTHTRTEPVSLSQWNAYFDSQGKLIVDELTVRKAIFCGGLDPSVRKTAWLFLTGVYPWSSSTDEREKINHEKRESYLALKDKWALDEEYRNTPKFQDQKHRIDKDVHRTDRSIDIFASEDMPNPDPVMNVGTNANLELLKELLVTYNVYNTELGYVQGMSDLLSPLFASIKDVPMVFWAFVGFMERMKSNFYTDQSGMHRQLLTMDHLLQFMDPSLYKHFQRTDSGNFFFCFRWLLVWYKREFSWSDMLTLWEVLWTDYLGTQFHLFVALSIMDQHREVIIEYLKSFDEILKYTNDLSMTINLEETLQRAEILYYQFKQRVEAVDDKKHTLEASLKSASNDQEKKEAQDDLNKLPAISEPLREILQTHHFTTHFNEKE
ncbi:RabGAP/TBC [Backusella circina FSU 941]|nr:RabGAP/TBC [Backusella circina FSU 941]